MTITIPDCAARSTATERQTADLEELVLGEPGRPCIASDATSDEWFPEEPGTGNQGVARSLYEALALRLCRGCPVALECLELTLRREGPARGHGISGGTAPWQRQAIKASRGWPVRRG
jgi:hypothetical protein